MLSIVLVNWNGWADTLACTQSILNSESTPFRIIVVDNMSPNSSLEAFERWSTGDLELLRPDHRIESLATAGAAKPRRVQFLRYAESTDTFEPLRAHGGEGTNFVPDIYVVVSGRNGGFGFGCNVGMRLADQLGSDGYWLLNNDCVVNPSALREVAAAVSARPQTALGTVVRYYDSPEVIQAYAGGKLSPFSGKSTMATARVPEARLNYIYGASAAFSRHIRSTVGDFDQRIFMYYEEMDFCIRIAKAGFDFGVVETDVYHRHGGSQGGVSVAAWRNVLSNKWYVLHKHFGWGFWVLNFTTALLVRCVNPFGSKNAMLGARQALRSLITKKVFQ